MNTEVLEQDIRTLVKERNELRDRLSRFRPDRGGRGKRGRGGGLATVAINGATLRISQTAENLPQAAKRQRAQTKHVYHKNEGRLETLDDEEHSINPNAFPVEKRPKINLDVPLQTRNRKLFGSLLGHLKRAKTTLDKEKDTKQAELHLKQEVRVTQKLKYERQNLEELSRRDRREKKRKDVDRIRELQKEIAAKDIELLRVNLENHYTRMANFIRTRAEPTLFWLPAIHTETTRKLQSETKMAIDHKIASLREQLEAELEALQLDYSQRKDAYILSHTNSNATVTSKVCDKHNDENENENENEAEDMNDENNECIQNNSDVHNEC